MKTYVAKPSTIDKQWYVVDAPRQDVGSMSTVVADSLRGKRKPIYTPNIDTGDFVIVVNAPRSSSPATRPTTSCTTTIRGIPAVSERSSSSLGSPPRGIVRHAVRGMLPHNHLGRAQLRKLKIYAGPHHPHQAQNPEVLELKE